MKAKKKPLDEQDAESLGVDLDPRVKVLKTSEPPSRKAGIKVGSAGELVKMLRDQAGVLQ
jgi:electron transfer flavoprotein beta subunit